jgi:hypothetical protein
MKNNEKILNLVKALKELCRRDFPRGKRGEKLFDLSWELYVLLSSPSKK